MDINNIQALIAQGLITDVASVDPNKAYVAVGVYQPGNRQIGSAGNAYPLYAISVAELLAGTGSVYTASNGISLVGNDFQFTSQNVSQFINDANYIAGTGSIGFVPRWDLTNVLGNSIIFDDGLGKVGIANTSPSETLDVTGTLKVSAGTHILRGLVGSPAISALYMGVVPGATNYILAYNGGNSYINGTTVNVAIAGSVKELTTATYSEILQNLGIGIVPTEALHVNGNALLSNQTYRYKIGNYDALGITQGVGSPNIIVGHGNTMNDASNGGGIVIGFGATSSSDGISIGLSAVVSGASEDGIAIGRSATVAVGVIRGAAFGRDALSSADNAFAIGNYVVANTPDTIIFGTNTAGNKQKVGIGTTNPDATLHIKGDANAGTYALKVYNLAGTTPLLCVRNDGNIGVGTANPLSKLYVNSSIQNEQIVLNNDDITGSSYFGLAQSGGIKAGMILLNSNHPFIPKTLIVRNLWDNGSIRINGGSGDTNIMYFDTTTFNVGIGTTTPNASALLDLTSTTGSLLVPRMTTAQKNALTPANGMIVYDSTLDKFQGYEAGAWANLI